MRRRSQRIKGVCRTFLALALAGAPGAALAQAPKVVGQVASLQGGATAQRPGQAPRPLACRDAVHAGETIQTASGSRVGLLLGDMLAQLGEDSAVRVGQTPDGAPDATLEQGEVRVIDPRDDGAPARLAVLDSEARVLGNDAEAYIFDEKTGRYAMLCEWEGSLPVARAGERSLVEPSRCVIAKPSEPLYQADAHGERIGAPGGQACAPAPLLLGALDDRFSPLDVAAGPPGGFAPDLPPGTGPLIIRPCDVPGSGCGGGPPGGGGPINGGGPIGVVEPPPIGGGFPGQGRVAEPPAGGGGFPGAP